MSQNKTVTSTGGLFPHTHKLTIPAEAIQSPPEDGITLQTSEEYSLIFKHKHFVKLSQADLQKIKAGHEVTVHDTDKGRHSFKI